MPEIKKQYQELAKKHKLPEFDELNKEFEISNLDETDFLLRSILGRIGEKLEFHLSTFGEILHPDSSNLYSIQEYRFFDEKERNKMFNIYRILMALSRSSMEVLLMCEDKEEAKLINEIFNKWKELKPDIIKFFRKMKEAWKTDTDIKDDLGYLG